MSVENNKAQHATAAKKVAAGRGATRPVVKKASDTDGVARKSAPAKKATAKKVPAKKTAHSTNMAAATAAASSDRVGHVEGDGHARPTGMSRPAVVGRVQAIRGRLPEGNRLVVPLGGVAVILLAVVLVLGFLNLRHDQKVDAGAEAQKVSADHAAQLLSYTPSTVSSDLAKETKWLTGDFADEYATLVKSKVAPAAEEAGVTASATVVARGLEDVSKDRVTMLLFVNLSTTKTGADEAQTQGSRVRVTAEKVDGEWLIGELKPL